MEKNKFNELLNEIKMICLVYKPKDCVLECDFGGATLYFNECKISQKFENEITLYTDMTTEEQIDKIGKLVTSLGVEW